MQVSTIKVSSWTSAACLFGGSESSWAHKCRLSHQVPKSTRKTEVQLWYKSNFFYDSIKSVFPSCLVYKESFQSAELVFFHSKYFPFYLRRKVHLRRLQMWTHKTATRFVPFFPFHNWQTPASQPLRWLTSWKPHPETVSGLSPTNSGRWRELRRVSTSTDNQNEIWQICKSIKE